MKEERWQFCIFTLAMNINSSVPIQHIQADTGWSKETVLVDWRNHKFKNCTNPMIFGNIISGGYDILRFNMCQVQTILSFQRITIWPGWHQFHASFRSDSTLSADESNFIIIMDGEWELKSTAAVRRAFGTKFHPRTPKKIPNGPVPEVYWQLHQECLSAPLGSGLPPTPDLSIQQVKDVSCWIQMLTPGSQWTGWGWVMGRCGEFWGRFWSGKLTALTWCRSSPQPTRKAGL